MPRQFRHHESRQALSACRADDHAQAARLRDVLYAKLMHYRRALGPAEIYRRARQDIFDTPGHRVEWPGLDGPPTDEDRARALARLDAAIPPELRVPGARWPDDEGDDAADAGV